MPASWVKGATDRINSLGLMAPSRQLLQESPNASTFTPIPKNLRDRKVAPSPSRPGRFDLTISRNEPETEGESPTYNFSLSNQFVRIGGKTYDADCEAATYVDVPCILCIFIDISGSTPAFELNTCADLEDLNDCESDPDVYILPLYTIDENGSITCDWRIGLDASMGEFGS